MAKTKEVTETHRVTLDISKKSWRNAKLKAAKEEDSVRTPKQIMEEIVNKALE